jgi:hypothetical protein
VAFLTIFALPRPEINVVAVNRFVIIIAAIVAIMAALVFLPSVSRPSTIQQSSNNGTGGGSADASIQLSSIDYALQNITSGDQNDTTALHSIQLSVTADGSAKYIEFEPSGQAKELDFTLAPDELAHIKSLIMETGFMQIPNANYPQLTDAKNFTRYSLTVHATSDIIGGQGGISGSNSVTKSMVWVNPTASNGVVPPIVRNIGAQLDEIIANHR